MKHIKTITILISFVVIILNSNKTYGCTMFKITKNGKTIVGNNEDWVNPDTRIWFETGKKGKYGVAYVGFDDLHPQGAFNDRGLVFDMFAMPYKTIKDTLNKKKQTKNFLKYIMKHCANVDEVKAMLSKYNLHGFEKVMLLFVDKTGKYLIVEGDSLTIGEKEYYVLSNFSPSQTSKTDEVDIPHYQRGKRLLESRIDTDITFCETVLDSLHRGDVFWGGTQYSSLYDLNNGTINLYYFHNYNHTVQLNLKEELNKGDHVLNIPEMFPDVKEGHEYSDIYHEFKNNVELLRTETVFSDTLKFRELTVKLKEGKSKEKMIYVYSNNINQIGYEWLKKKNYKNAISVFKFHTEVFYWRSNPFDSLGEAYFCDKQYDMALKSYKKVLEIEPNDKNALQQINKIEKLMNQ